MGETLGATGLERRQTQVRSFLATIRLPPEDPKPVLRGLNQHIQAPELQKQPLISTLGPLGPPKNFRSHPSVATVWLVKRNHPILTLCQPQLLQFQWPSERAPTKVSTLKSRKLARHYISTIFLLIYPTTHNSLSMTQYLETDPSREGELVASQIGGDLTL